MGGKDISDLTQDIIKLTIFSFAFIVVLLFLAIILLQVKTPFDHDWPFVKNIIPQFIWVILAICIVVMGYWPYSPYISKLSLYTSNLFTGSNLKWLIAILSLGFALRLAYIILIPTLPVSDFRTYHDFAVNLIENGVYGFGTTPDCYRSPGESFFLFIIYKIVGSTDFIYPKLVQVLLGTLNIVLIYLIAKKAFNEKVAIIAALLMSIFPTQIFYTSIIASENLFTFLNLLALSIFMSLNKDNKLYYPSLFAMGVLLGCAALVRPVSILLPVLILAIILLKDFRVKAKGFSINKSEFKTFAIAALIFAIAVALIVVPWCMRNYFEFNHFSISSNGGLAFWVGNNEYATGLYNYPIEPIMYEKFGDISKLNDFQREDLLYSDAKKYILTHPVDTAILDIKKLSILYGSSTLGIYWSMLADGTLADHTLQNNLNLLCPLLVSLSNGYYYLILFTALIGLPILVKNVIKDKKYLALALLVYVVYFSVMYSISLVDDRYNFNILPILAILSAYTIARVFEKKPDDREA